MGGETDWRCAVCESGMTERTDTVPDPVPSTMAMMDRVTQWQCVEPELFTLDLAPTLAPMSFTVRCDEPEPEPTTSPDLNSTATMRFSVPVHPLSLSDHSS